MNAGYSKGLRWLLGVLFALMATLAFAKPSSAPRGDVPRGTAHSGGFFRPVQQSAPGGGHWYGLQPGTRVSPGDRNFGTARRPASAYSGLPHLAAQDRSFRADGEPVRYAGAITPVSAEGRAVPRPPVNAPVVRTGSIRADVARYNEERGAVRSIPHPPDDVPRPPPPSPYRN
ncbi:hypothetical protein [Paraburkholderia gardini]|uniref:Peptide-binding protein n=1 Tax=Paraburkholderia gardini TaxID=2823469 RepID=A0ABN7QL06_9BURK|nr:hypothetical protein [Paraburkholderia gardini]CAG4894926.1 hypothetical protein R54767_01814 [Paraburkholderia gardini]